MNKLSFHENVVNNSCLSRKVINDNVLIRKQLQQNQFYFNGNTKKLIGLPDFVEESDKHC